MIDSLHISLLLLILMCIDCNRRSLQLAGLKHTSVTLRIFMAFFAACMLNKAHGVNGS